MSQRVGWLAKCNRYKGENIFTVTNHLDLHSYGVLHFARLVSGWRKQK